MSIRIELLTPDQETDYEELLHSIKHSLLYASLKYRNFLKRILVDSQDFYLVAYESGQLVGALPSFIKSNKTYGNVLNSLPFYGSNSGVMVSPNACDSKAVKLSLLDAFHSMAQQNSVVTSTIISNPLDTDVGFYEAHSQYTLRDERLGQVVVLPTSWDNDKDLQIVLMGMFHEMRRRNIRKAQKSDIIVSHSDSLEAMEALARLHQQNIEAIGGRPKPWSVFVSLRETFTYNQDYRLYLAQKDNIIISALLVFFYNQTVEYFTPTTLETFRVYQPMSLLIYEAMQEAARRGCKYWNWGGTWLEQDGVYKYKSRWGALDLPYYYYIREYEGSSDLRQLTANELLAEYPFFYVLPFKVLPKA
ncbi:MAG: hypothetical protein Fur006_01110 [Coleofasciculaceae cyanobacterium]